MSAETFTGFTMEHVTGPIAGACAGPVSAAPAAAPAPAAPGGARSAPLPRLSSTISDKPSPLTCAQGLPGIEFKQTPYQNKALYALRENIAQFIHDVGIERVGFLTLTFDHKVYDVDEAARHFNSLNRRVLKEAFGGWIRIIEQHQDGAWHYHLLVEMSCDIRTGFDFKAFEASKEEYMRHG